MQVAKASKFTYELTRPEVKRQLVDNIRRVILDERSEIPQILSIFIGMLRARDENRWMSMTTFLSSVLSADEIRSNRERIDAIGAHMPARVSVVRALAEGRGEAH
jgi:hypothetical protein